MTMGPFEFRPRLVPTLVTVLLLPVLAGLGLWQLDRAAQKRGILADYEARSQGEPVVLSGAGAHRGEDLRYYRARATGRFEGEHQLLLDNKTWQGRVGFEVLTPLRLPGGGAVLVNRGWVPVGRTRADLPEPEAPAGSVAVTGTLKAPSRPGIVLGPAMREGGGWPRVVQYVDIEQLERTLDTTLVPYVLLLDPKTPHGFKRQWDVLPFGPARHTGYAVQWFALAVALVVIYIVVNTRRRRAEEREGE